MNHLGDRNEFLPTVHGFDEFFGNLYHLNAEEEPENVDYPKSPQFAERFGPRGVLKTKATDHEDPTNDLRFGKVGNQTIVDTGPLMRKRMESADEEFLAATLDAMDRVKAANKPFFIGTIRPACIFGRISRRIRGHGRRKGTLRRGHDRAR